MTASYNICFPFPYPTADISYIIGVAKKCMRHIYKKHYHYHKAGLILLDLVPHSNEQLNLLSQRQPKNITLMQTIDEINSECGRNAIFFYAQGINRN